jgi:hypothetical protein
MDIEGRSRVVDYKLIAAIGSGIIAGACLMIWVIVQVRDRISNPTVNAALTQLLYLLDEQCDNMEVPAKRAQVIMAVQQLMGWRRLFLPTVVVGFVLDMIVKIVRKIGVPDLHKTEVADNESMP